GHREALARDRAEQFSAGPVQANSPQVRHGGGAKVTAKRHLNRADRHMRGLGDVGHGDVQVGVGFDESDGAAERGGAGGEAASSDCLSTMSSESTFWSRVAHGTPSGTGKHISPGPYVSFEPLIEYSTAPLRTPKM